MGKKGKQPPPAEPPPPPPPVIIRIFYRGNDDAKVSVSFDKNGGFEALFDAAAGRLGWRPAAVLKDEKLVADLGALEDVKLLHQYSNAGQLLSFHCLSLVSLSALPRSRPDHVRAFATVRRGALPEGGAGPGRPRAGAVLAADRARRDICAEVR